MEDTIIINSDKDKDKIKGSKIINSNKVISEDTKIEVPEKI